MTNDRNDRVAEKTALVLLASEQLWPNLFALEWIHQTRQLTDVYVIHTADQTRSAVPARRIKAFCSRYEGVQVHLPVHEVDSKPESVVQQIQKWRKALPNRRWMINITGGTKLMAIGALDVLCEPDTEAFYRDVDGRWMIIERHEGKIISQPLDVPYDLLSEVPVEDLVRAQWLAAGSGDVSSSPVMQIDVEALLQASINHDWDWTRAFEDIGVNLPAAQRRSGFAFEQFVAATIGAMGVKRVRLNLEYKSADGQPLQECDVVAAHADRLLLIDCKLRDADAETRGDVETIGSQIRQAAEIKRQLGGLRAEALLIRPNRKFSKPERVYADESNVGVIDRDDALTFFTHLADFIGLDNTARASAERLQTILDSAVIPQGRFSQVFATPTKQERLQHREKPGARSVVNLPELLKNQREQFDQPWDAYLDHQGRIFLAATADRPGKERAQLEEAIRAMLESTGARVNVTRVGANSKTCRFELVAKKQIRSKLLRKLDDCVGKPLLPG